MKKLFTLAFLCVSLSAFSQPKYVGRFFGDGAGLTNMNLTGLKNYGNIVTNQVPLTAGLPVVGDGGSGVVPTNNLTVATATAQQFLISGVSNKVAVFQSNGVMVGTNTVHISGQFISDTAPGFIGGGSSISNIPMSGLQGSGGSGTAATNGTAGMRWTSSGNGGGYWSSTSGSLRSWFVGQLNSVSISAASPRYLSITSPFTSTTEANVECKVPGGVYSNLTAHLIFTLQAGTNCAVTLVTNGVDSNITCNVNTGNGVIALFDFVDTTHSVTLSNLSTMTWKVSTDSASAWSAQVMTGIGNYSP